MHGLEDTVRTGIGASTTRCGAPRPVDDENDRGDGVIDITAARSHAGARASFAFGQTPSGRAAPQ